MISVIICCRKASINLTLADNIRSTIGVGHELIVIDNSRGGYSIFQAYNIGVGKAKGDILCFMHDDILFLSNNWGKIVEDSFATDSQIGALGIAGGHFLPDCPCSWSTCKTTSFHVWQTNMGGSATECVCNNYSDGEKLVDVACLDGLFMCIRHDLFNNIRFDDQTFTGFHCYDSDICMQVLDAGFCIKVSFDIDIEHRSNGVCNQQYFENIGIWYEKWHNRLPITRGISLTESEKRIHQSYAIELIERGKETLTLYEKLSGLDYRIGHLILKPFRFLKKTK